MTIYYRTPKRTYGKVDISIGSISQPNPRKFEKVKNDN